MVCHQPPDDVTLLDLPPQGVEPGAGAVSGVEEEVLGLRHSVHWHRLPGQTLAPLHVATGGEQAWGDHTTLLTSGDQWEHYPLGWPGQTSGCGQCQCSWPPPPPRCTPHPVTLHICQESVRCQHIVIMTPTLSSSTGPAGNAASCLGWLAGLDPRANWTYISTLLAHL